MLMRSNQLDLHDAMNEISTDTPFISRNFEKSVSNKTKLDGLFPLYFYQYKFQNWHKYVFKENKRFFTIGPSPEADLTIKTSPQSYHEIIIQLLDNMWLITSSKKQQAVGFNGCIKHQDYLWPRSLSLLQINDAKVIITNRDKENCKSQIILKGSPSPEEYSIETPTGEYRFPLNRNMLIGSEAICDIKINSPQFGAIITSFKNRVQITNLGNDDILVDGLAVSATTYLSDGSKITINNNEMTFHLSADSPINKTPEVESFADRLCLMAISEQGKVEKMLVLPRTEQSLDVGRSKECDISLDSDNISRKHAQLILYEDNILIMDCYSTNGTYINNQKIGQKRAHPGNFITFGDKSFILCYYE